MPAAILHRVVVTDSDGDEVGRDEVSSAIADEVGVRGVRQLVTLGVSFTALSPPTGAAYAQIRWVSGTGTWTLKGVTGDTGVSIGTPTATSPALCLPISSPSIGITASSAGSCEVLWL